MVTKTPSVSLPTELAEWLHETDYSTSKLARIGMQMQRIVDSRSVCFCCRCLIYKGSSPIQLSPNKVMELGFRPLGESGVGFEVCEECQAKILQGDLPTPVVSYDGSERGRERSNSLLGAWLELSYFAETVAVYSARPAFINERIDSGDVATINERYLSAFITHRQRNLLDSIGSMDEDDKFHRPPIWSLAARHMRARRLWVAEKRNASGIQTPDSLRLFERMLTRALGMTSEAFETPINPPLVVADGGPDHGLLDELSVKSTKGGIEIDVEYGSVRLCPDCGSINTFDSVSCKGCNRSYRSCVCGGEVSWGIDCGESNPSPSLFCNECGEKNHGQKGDQQQDDDISKPRDTIVSITEAHRRLHKSIPHRLSSI
jgi:hypothetical protein